MCRTEDVFRPLKLGISSKPVLTILLKQKRLIKKYHLIKTECSVRAKQRFMGYNAYSGFHS